MDRGRDIVIMTIGKQKGEVLEEELLASCVLRI